MPLSRLLLATALTLALGGAAQAFTIQGGPGSEGPRSNWRDLDTGKEAANDPKSRFDSENGRTTYKNGNSTLYFGSGRSFDQRYNSDNLFNPYHRDGR